MDDSIQTLKAEMNKLMSVYDDVKFKPNQAETAPPQDTSVKQTESEEDLSSKTDARKNVHEVLKDIDECLFTFGFRLFVTNLSSDLKTWKAFLLRRQQLQSASPCRPTRAPSPGLLRATTMLSWECITRTRSQVKYFDKQKRREESELFSGQKTLSPKPLKKSFKTNKRNVGVVHFEQSNTFFHSYVT